VHANSARFHLDGLVAAGLAERSAEDRSAPGRPTVLYAASAALPADEEGYRELAGILTAALSTGGATPSAAAEAAGAARGLRLASDVRGVGELAEHTEPVTADEAGQAVVDGLGQLGFESRAVASRQGARIDIRPCPFLGLAHTHGDVICSVHRGLVAGMLDGMGAPLSLDRLEPFAEPDRCVAHLRR